MEIVRIGIIGAGWVTQERHLPRLQKVREATVDRIWSWHPENARKVADTFGIPSTPRNWREIVDDESIDAVDTEIWNGSVGVEFRSPISNALIVALPVTLS